MDAYLECIKCKCHIFPKDNAEGGRPLWEERVNDELVGLHKCMLFACMHENIRILLLEKGIQ